MLIRMAGIVAAATLVVSAAPSAKPSDPPVQNGVKQCFFLSQVDGYTRVKGSHDRIRVTTGPRDTYEFQVFAPCPYLGDAEHMGFDQAGGGTICSGLDVDLIVPTPAGPPERCPVRMIRKLAPAER